MAKYTEVLHDLLTNEVTNDLINKAMSTYPIYTPKHEQLYGFIPSREELNKKILDHYRWYEIGSETVGRFLFNFETTLNQIMPYYNQLYKSVDVMNGLDDIFGNLDVVESFEETTTGASSSESKDNLTGKTTNSNESHVESSNETTTDMDTSGRNVKSTTPQSQLGVKTIDNITAASEINWNEDSNTSLSNSDDESTSTGSSETNVSNNSTSEASSESTGTTKHTLSRKGNQGVNTYAHDMLEFRQLFLNIEQQIINDPELAKCFMLIW